MLALNRSFTPGVVDRSRSVSAVMLLRSVFLFLPCEVCNLRLIKMIPLVLGILVPVCTPMALYILMPARMLVVNTFFKGQWGSRYCAV